MKTTRQIPQTAERLTLALAGVLVLFIGLLAYDTWLNFARRSEQAEITQQVLDGTTALLSSLKDAETGQRGFLLTGEDRYLGPYLEAMNDVPGQLNRLSEVTAVRRPDQALRVEQLRPLIKAKLDELGNTIEVRRSQGPEAALAIVRTDHGKALMDQIRASCAEIQSVDNGRLKQFSEKARAGGNRLGLVASFGSAGLLVLLFLATATIQRGTRRREELIESLAERETQARESRDWLQTTLNSIGDGVITTDANGNVALLNGVAQSLTGWKQEEAVGKPLDQVFVIRNAETGLEVESPVAKALREGRIVGLANHTRLIARDGRHIPIDDSAAPIRDGLRIAGVVLVFRDVSERLKAEERIRLTVEKLRITNRALVRANEDLNQFAFAASHDLQEPLRMITSYSQLLLKSYRGQFDGEASTCVEFITDGTRRMRELLSDLLAYTQVTGDAQEPVAPVDLNEVLQATIENCWTAIDGAGATVTSDRLPAVLGHRPHFVQLFQNLISNGLKYRGEHPPRIHVSAEQEDRLCRMAVKDNGIGIPPEYHKQIFGVFKRLHGKTIPGTGIGLAICQRVVDRYGGQIWVESQVGQGATFYFTLPAAAKGGVAHEE